MKTLSLLYEEFETRLNVLNYSQRTIRGRRISIRKFIRWLELTHEISTADQLRPRHLHGWQQHLANCKTRFDKPLTSATCNRNISSIRGFLKHLASYGYVQVSLPQSLQNLKEPQRLPGSVLSHDQMKKLLNSIPLHTPLGYRNRAILELLYTSGLRASEILGLSLHDVDFQNCTARVVGKGDKERAVPIGKTAMRYLESYLTAMRPFLLKDLSEKALFLNNTGGRLTYNGFRAMVHVYGDQMDIKENITPHTFRRSCTTELIRSGANIYHVKELLGHATLETLKDYTKLTILDLKKTHKKCHPREKD